MQFIHSARHKGQALPLALVLLAAVAAMLFFMFNSGQLVQEKIRLTNTADAVAYSAGVFEARVLNYDAYTNRAIIANEIAIGQAVGLASWTKYAGTASTNLAPWLNLIPVVGPPIASLISNVEPGMDAFSIALAGQIIAHETVIRLLSLSQFAVHGPTDTVLPNAFALAGRQVVMRDVANKNDPDAAVDWVPLEDDFKDFTQQYTSRTDRRTMGQLVQDSRDAFLTSRHWDLEILPSCGWLIALSLANPSLFDVKLRKRGSTELIDLTEGWKSMDTLSAHVVTVSWHRISRWNPIRRPRCDSTEVPVGYGKAYTDSGLAEPPDYARSRATNPQASSMADGTIARGFAPPSPTSTPVGVIPSFYDLSQSVMTKTPNDPRTSLTIRVTKASSKQRFSGGTSVVKPSGRLALYDGAHVAGESAAVSRVEVYFERPDGNNPWRNREEIGSLFNPYWQVRLAPVSTAQRALAHAKNGNNVVLP